MKLVQGRIPFIQTPEQSKLVQGRVPFIRSPQPKPPSGVAPSPPSSNIASFGGVARASIASINGVALASISSINGVS